MDYCLRGIYNLTRMMKNNGYQVSLIEKDADRRRWLEERLGGSVIHTLGCPAMAGHDNICSNGSNSHR